MSIKHAIWTIAITLVIVGAANRTTFGKKILGTA